MSTGFLISIPGKIQTCVDDLATLKARLTATVAGRIDASISSRAAASTALQRSVWTNQRAAALDNLASILTLVTSTNSVVGKGAAAYQGIATESITGLGGALNGLHNVGTLGTHSTRDSTWTTLIDVSGSGIIDLLAFRASAHDQNTDLGVRVTIDGVSVYGTDTDNLGGHAVNTDMDDYGLLLNGLAISDGTDYASGIKSLNIWPIPFASDFKVEMYAETGSSNTGVILGSYRTF